MRICSNCGAEIGATAKFCTRCGTRAAAELPQRFPPPVPAYLRLEIVQPRQPRSVELTTLATVGVAVLGVVLVILVILLLLQPATALPA